MLPEALEITDGMWAAIASVVVALLVFAASRLSGRADVRTAKTQTDVTAGVLALDIAKRADAQSQDQEKRLKRIESWRRKVLDDWWPVHDARDRAIETELLQLDPSYVITERVPLPALADDAD